VDNEPPLAGLRILDFSTLLPGPLTTLMLADAGADVVKIERPELGDEVRSYSPKIGDTSAIYALLNRGKRAYAADLSHGSDQRQVLRLASRAHVVVEQFRPGVADRLGIGYEQIRAVNPAVVYCSISGYGQSSELKNRAGHDLNYLAQSGLLGVVTDPSGSPYLPVTNLADIAGGSYPAVLNILLALRRSETTDHGCHIDISMTHNLQVLAFANIAARQAGGGWPQPNAELLTGGSPRYHIYRTADGRHLAVAALEQKFWLRFVELIGLAPEHRQDIGNEQRVITEVGSCITRRPAEHWRGVFATQDACATVVDTFGEAAAVGLTDTDASRRISGDGYDVAALHSPISAHLLERNASASIPSLEQLPADIDRVWG
jgi:crotonobetainyl-CoA:carnitine CoA-transferase CaiB-like acyl-CoA transferase